MDLVPIEIIQNHVFEILNLPEQIAFMKVCKRFYNELFIKKLVDEMLTYVNGEFDLNQYKYSKIEILDGSILFANVSVVNLSKFTNLKILRLDLHKHFSVSQNEFTALINLEEFVTTSSQITSVNHLKKLRVLSCLNESKIDQNGINLCTTIEELYISFQKISSVNHLPNLRKLKCNDTIKQNGILLCTNLESLDIISSSFSDINHLKKLKSLIYIMMNRNIVDFSKLYNLEYLDISHNINITSLNQFKKLRILRCTHSTIEQDGISELTNLEKLFCVGTKITSVNHLTKLKELVAVESQINQNGISQLRNLELLISNNNINSLNHLTKLNMLLFDGSSLKKIYHCTNITHLEINNSSIKSVNSLTKLETFNCRGNSKLEQQGIIGIINLKYFRCPEKSNIIWVNHLTNLLVLDCSGNCGIDQNGINQCTTLQELYCQNNTKITNVNHLVNLTHLNCSNSNIDQNGISQLRNLRNLTCKTNPYITSIKHLTKLKRFDFDNSTKVPKEEYSKFCFFEI
jgi:Leucine-rich repeat (LRR) protein